MITRDTRLAAALGTLGVPIEIRKTLDARSGRMFYQFQLGLRSECGRYLAARLKHQIRSGRLERMQPDHEALTALRGMRNRELILDLQNKGRFIWLAEVPKTNLWQYVPGDSGLPGARGQKEVIETKDLKMAAALGIVGVPLLAVYGGRGDHSYILPRFGLPGGNGGPADAARLMKAWRNNRDALPPDCPFSQAMWGLLNRERLVNALHAEIESILLRKPRSMKSAIVRSDATDKAFDRVKEHFDQS